MNLIVLHTTRYSENSLILHAYTEEGGRESFLIRGAYGNKGKRQAINCLHPLSILNYEIIKGGRGTLKVLREFNPDTQLEEIRSRIDKGSIAMFIAELLYRGIRESIPDPALYSLLDKSIRILDTFPHSCANFHLWFMVHLCIVLGFSPSGEYAHDYNPFSQEQMLLLNILRNDDFGCIYDVKLNREERGMLVQSIIKYLEFHLGIHLNMKSLDILHAIFSI